MSVEVITNITTHDDGKFVRTALLIGEENKGSIDIIGKDGTRVAQLNFFSYDNGNFIVDVIDINDQYTKRNAITFDNGMPSHHKLTSKLVSVDFRGRK